MDKLSLLIEVLKCTTAFECAQLIITRNHETNRVYVTSVAGVDVNSMLHPELSALSRIMNISCYVTIKNNVPVLTFHII